LGAHSPYRTGSKILCARAEGPGDAPRTGTAGAGQGQQRRRRRRRRRRSGEGSRSRSRSGKGSEQAAVKVTEPAGAREQARAQIVARQEEGQGTDEKRLRFSALSVVFNNNARHKMHVVPRQKRKREKGFGRFVVQKQACVRPAAAPDPGRTRHPPQVASFTASGRPGPPVSGQCACRPAAAGSWSPCVMA